MAFVFSLNGDPENFCLSRRDLDILYSSKFMPALQKAFDDLDRSFVPMSSRKILESFTELVRNIPGTPSAQLNVIPLRSSAMYLQQTYKKMLKNTLIPYFEVIRMQASQEKPILDDATDSVRALARRLMILKPANKSKNPYYCLVHGTIDDLLKDILIACGAHSWTRQEPLLLVVGSNDFVQFKQLFDTEWQKRAHGNDYSSEEVFGMIRYRGSVPRPMVFLESAC